MNLPVAVFCPLTFGILAKLSSRLKKVSLAGGTLDVSNYLKQVRVHPARDATALTIPATGLAGG